MSGPFKKNNNMVRKKSPLPPSRSSVASSQKPPAYFNPSFNVSPVRPSSQSSTSFFNHQSPFYQKKMNDINSIKYKNRLKKQQQYWNYGNRRGQFPTRALNAFANAPSIKVTDLDYAMNYGYLNQVIPPTQDAIEEYTLCPLDTTDIPPPASLFQSPYQNDNIETIFTNKPIPNYAGLSNEEARQALIRHVSNNYCLNKSYAKRMHILNIENSFIYTVTLETFSEKRQTSWSYEPYTGGFVDNMSHGSAPPVWDIVPLYNPKPFRDHVETIIVPHSETIRSCFLCKSNGRLKCTACHGVGWDTYGKKSCNDYFFYLQYHSTSALRDFFPPWDKCYAIQHKIDSGEPCFQCEGGRKKCYNCNGYGVINCKVCLGTGQLKCFLKLTITWKNHMDEYLPEAVIPRDKLKFVSGDIIYNETNVKVTPISYLTNGELSKASQRLISKHEETYLTQERPIMQRQLIQVIQVAAVHYQYRNKLGIFYVFGKEPYQKVYAPNYPKSFCCPCCTII